MPSEKKVARRTKRAARKTTRKRKRVARKTTRRTKRVARKTTRRTKRVARRTAGQARRGRRKSDMTTGRNGGKKVWTGKKWAYVSSLSAGALAALVFGGQTLYELY